MDFSISLLYTLRFLLKGGNGVVLFLVCINFWEISAYITHKNLSVRKIMEAMRTAYAKKRDSVSTSQTKHDANDHGTYEYVKGKRASFAKNIFFFAESFD